ncbi:MAG TPA: hypothetical protein VGP89_06435 [Candidatus Angelobacter sp.]|jgi:hypothetical protein|nr:hypothetical protein [Candidatus Angelobacter sp.]
MRRALHAIFACIFLTVGVTLLFAAQSQPTAQLQKPDDIPVTDGTSGPCSIEFSVTDSEGKSVYAARIDVHMAYGAFGAHKLDMGVYTNAQGKARFTGIPAKVRKPPIEFSAKKDDLVGAATMDPATECKANHDIVMAKSSH